MTPLPAETREAAAYIRDTPPETIIKARDAQLTALDELAYGCKMAESKWDACIPEDIAPESGKFQTVAMKQLANQLGMGGSAWLDQFAYGFLITGQMSQKHLFPAAPPKYDRVAKDRIPHASAARFRERAAKSGQKNDQPHMGRGHASSGKRAGASPTPLSADGAPLSWHSMEFNIPFRPGAIQTDKLRACDDLKRSVTNLACTVETHIPLASWGNVAQLSNILASKGGDWVMFEAAHKSAYKQLPIDPADQASAIVALRHPMEGKRYGFVTRTLISGSIASVLHYNVLSRTLTALVNRYLGLPLVGYFDDSAAIISSSIGHPAMNAFARFARAIGFELRDGKSDLEEEVAFLGLSGSFPASRNGGQLRISLLEGKRAKWPKLISAYVMEGGIPHRWLDKLIGLLSFSQAALFGKFARTQLRPMYRKLRRREYTEAFTAYERSILEWRPSIIAEIAPRLARPRPLKPDRAIYTGASTTPAEICALLFFGCRSSHGLHSCYAFRVDIARNYLLRHTNLIYGLELLALVLFF